MGGEADLTGVLTPQKISMKRPKGWLSEGTAPRGGELAIFGGETDDGLAAGAEQHVLFGNAYFEILTRGVVAVLIGAFFVHSGFDGL